MNFDYSDEHINYLYETSYERELERKMDWQIQEKLAEERKKEANYKDYVKNNYIRIGDD